jgi:nicotinamidase-related amidase
MTTSLRGPRAPRTDLDPSRTIVVVIECQEGVLGPNSILPDLAAELGDLVDRLGALLGAARASGVPVVHATFEGLLPGASPGPAPLWRVLAGAGAEWAPGHPGTQVVDALRAPDDLVLGRRHGLSPARDTGLIPALRGLGARTVVLTGVSTNLALPLTAGDLSEEGLALVVPRDAVGGTPASYAAQVVDHTLSTLAEISTVDALRDAWSSRPGQAVEPV